MKKILLILLLITSCFACSEPIKQKVDFLEVRITRYVVLEGARETIVLRKIDKNWSAANFGVGLFGSCNYQNFAQPMSNLADFWQKLVNEGLLEIPEGKFRSNCCPDGNGYEAEIFYKDKLKRFSFHIPQEIDSKEAKQIQNIGNLISKEFETPMFYAEYGRKEVGDYLIKKCEANQENTNK